MEEREAIQGDRNHNREGRYHHSCPYLTYQERGGGGIFIISVGGTEVDSNVATIAAVAAGGPDWVRGGTYRLICGREGG